MKSMIDALEQEQSITLLGQFHHTSGVQEGIVEREPNLVLFDVDDIRRCDVVSTITCLKKKVKEISIIMMTSSLDNVILLEAIQAGVDSLLLKDFQMEDAILHSIHHTIKDHSILPPTTTKALIERVMDLKENNIGLFHHRLHENDISLTLREAEVAYLMKQGLKNGLIAQKLNVNEGTVKVHVSKIYHKLNIKGRKNVVAFLNEIMLSTKKETSSTYESISG